MTRINLVNPDQLTNEHLMAEYRELPRIFTAVRKLKGQLPKDIPAEYTLGKGHCKFFYNKLEWLHARYVNLYLELIRRGYNLDSSIFGSTQKDAADLLHTSMDYNPTPQEIYKNMYRITVRHFKVTDEVFS